MANVFACLAFLSVIFFIVGLIKPSAGLFWARSNKTRKQSSLVYGLSFLVFFIALAAVIPPSPEMIAAREKEKLMLEREAFVRDSIEARQKADLAILEERKNDSIRKAKEITERTTRIEGQFSSWDGSHRNLEQYIKDRMNDPDSYKHDETSYWDLKTHLVVMTSFRGRNGFGGMVRHTVKAKVDLEGQVLEIIEQL